MLCFIVLHHEYDKVYQYSECKYKLSLKHHGNLRQPKTAAVDPILPTICLFYFSLPLSRFLISPFFFSHFYLILATITLKVVSHLIFCPFLVREANASYRIHLAFAFNFYEFIFILCLMKHYCLISMMPGQEICITEILFLENLLYDSL
jgi:hypothetical protein